MHKEKEIVVYFVGGQRARFPVDKVLIGDRNSIQDNRDTFNVSDGNIFVNWDNVAFIREWLEPEEDWL